MQSGRIVGSVDCVSGDADSVCVGVIKIAHTE